VRNGHGLVVDDAKLSQAVSSLAGMVRADAHPGTYQLIDGRVELHGGQAGSELDIEATKKLFVRALRGATANLQLPMKKAPAPPAPQHAIVVNLSRFQLDLYEQTSVSDHFQVGVGALRFPTPPGAYYIKSKAKNPSWRNPGSKWARSMPRYLPPGPRNPLGTRALRLDRGALVIHGTPQPWTIGRRSSHGCIRMRKADVERLYDIVAMGTPVFIVP
jgi:lipoprotein-anchoring transpeptidase ErfK/SrfK